MKNLQYGTLSIARRYKMDKTSFLINICYVFLVVLFVFLLFMAYTNYTPKNSCKIIYPKRVIKMIYHKDIVKDGETLNHVFKNVDNPEKESV